MSSSSAPHMMLPTAPIHVQPPEDAQRTARRLTALAVKGLVLMFDPEKQLFCFKLKKTATGAVREGLSRRYTMITLMGLHRLEESGANSPVKVMPVFEGLLTNIDWVDNIGDLGLLLWLCALVAPQRLEEVAERLDIKSALSRYRDARHGSSMELAWFLSGLSHGSLASPEKLSDLRDLAVETYRLLRKNQGEQGIFGHVAKSENLADIFRKGIGCFADQVYPIYAMTKFWQAFQYEKAAEKALDCALAICEAQGSLGQWWWHYDSSDGRVVGRYPVYSVHQHGMAPMVLFTLGEAIQSDFSPWIYKGLQWISDNELDFNMEDASANVVWRCISGSTARRYWKATIAKLTRREDRQSRDGIRVLFECRPYELGWLLYAFAGKGGQ
jgi:hypothetical protein